MVDVIVLRGPPGVGKTAAGKFLARSFPLGVTVEVDLVRWMINSATWTDDLEHRTALSAARDLTLAYLRSRYRPVVFIDNMNDQALTEFVEALVGFTLHSFVLLARDEVLYRRIDMRKGGFRDTAACLAMSSAISRSIMPGETIVDTSDLDVEDVGAVLLARIKEVSRTRILDECARS